MKTFVIVVVALLVACIQVNGESPRSFVEDYKNITDSLVSLQKNPSNIDVLSIKADALYRTSWQHGLNLRVYQSIFNILSNFRELTYVINSEHIMNDIIRNLEERFDSTFDELNMQRDFDEKYLPSKVNDIVDEFVERYTETLSELFDNMYTQAKHLEENAEKLADDSSTMLNKFAENIDKCLAVPITEYKEILQCRQKTREVVLPTLAHNSALLNIIMNDLKQLQYLKLDGKTSVYELISEMEAEKYNLLHKIQEVRDQREAEKEN